MQPLLIALNRILMTNSVHLDSKFHKRWMDGRGRETERNLQLFVGILTRRAINLLFSNLRDKYRTVSADSTEGLSTNLFQIKTPKIKRFKQQPAWVQEKTQLSDPVA